ncbi:AfsA-related hotdog domain-containing protein [Streptomyces sp. NPDC058371]|uniref:AfsA-related hotdog domain-containing protein n=1 Tax=Streptomyces sp. NPDC058371 TaxID=3346463 RepID=UPI00365B0161
MSDTTVERGVDRASVVVVGDRFTEFLALRGTIAASDLLARLRTGDIPGELTVSVGQGLSADQLSELSVLAAMNRGSVFIRQGEVPAHVEQRLTHKHDAKNVLIGPVEETGDGGYRAALLLDQRVEVLADHLTGLHIPAVTLLEAARQTWTVVTEQFLLDDEPPARFVISSVDSAFHRFVFPLPATVEYRLRGRERTPVGQAIAFTVSVRQGGEIAAEFTVEIRVIPQRFAEKQELMAARAAVRQGLAAAEAVAAEPVLAGAAAGR